MEMDGECLNGEDLDQLWVVSEECHGADLGEAGEVVLGDHILHLDSEECHGVVHGELDHGDHHVNSEDNYHQ